MQFDDVEKKLRQRPFEAFRLHLTDDTAYEVRHPELMLLGRRMAVVGLTTDPNQTFFDRTMDIDLFYIVRIEPIEMPVSPNGQNP
jgi:hypothetical protein